MGAVRFDGGPGGLRTSAGQIMKILPGEPLAATVLSPLLVGVWTHFIENRRTYPCTGAGPECCWNHRLTPLRWQGWLAVQRGVGGPVRYVCVTEGCLADYPALLSQGGELRGQVLQLGRAGAERNSRLWCRPHGRCPDARRLHPAPDIHKWLGCLWGSPARWEGADPMKVPPDVRPSDGCFSTGGTVEALEEEYRGRD